MKHKLRKTIQHLRYQLTESDIVLLSENLATKLIQFIEKKTWKDIAVYFSCNNEVKLNRFIEYCWKNNINTFLPIIPKDNTMKLLSFGDYNCHSILKKNRFGIPEPHNSKQISYSKLNAIIIPLIAFDNQGNRCGMGGGFYDKTLSVPEIRNSLIKIGVGYSFQKVAKVPKEHWDISLDMAFTPCQEYQFKKQVP